MVGSGPGFAPVGGGAALIPTCAEGPGIRALETRNFRSGCPFLPFLLVGRVLEPSITILELLGGKLQVGTPSMEGAELSRTGVKLGDALENQWERRKLRVLGNPTTACLFHLLALMCISKACPPSPNCSPARGAPAAP